MNGCTSASAIATKIRVAGAMHGISSGLSARVFDVEQSPEGMSLLVSATTVMSSAALWKTDALYPGISPMASRRSPNDHALRPSSEEPRPAPQLHPRGLHGLGHLGRVS
ncbi:hypothetical protein ASG80_11590 [Agromyces sp. Soil535]|nr:hypothetical protein ASG80_11590 [Agromyces sp. Soil535]